MWHAKTQGAYSRDSNEAKENAKMIYNQMTAYGWTLSAICGMLGNMSAESGYNPWRWQGDNVQSSTGSPWTNIGYGLVQFTPASKYIDSEDAKKDINYSPNFSDKPGNPNDGESQMNYVNSYADYLSTPTYPESYEDYKKSTQIPEYCARVWLYNYERPADPGSTESSREENARYWFDYLQGVEPEPPTPGVTSSSKMIYYLNKWKRYV